MAAPVKPTKHKAFVAEQWGFTPAVANLDTPTVLEINSASGLVLTFFFLGDMDALATQNVERVNLPRSLGEASTPESLGTTTYGGGTMRALWDPQGATGSDDVKAWETLLDATTGVAWNAQNIAPDATLAAGDFVDLYPIEIGQRFPTKTGSGSDAVWVFDAPFGLTGNPHFHKPLS